MNDTITETNRAYYKSEKLRSHNTSDEFASKIYQVSYDKMDCKDNEIALQENQQPQAKITESKVSAQETTPIKNHRSNKKQKHSQQKRILGSKRKKKENTEQTVNQSDEYCIEDCLFTRKDCNQKMIFCEGDCGTWYHLQCINMSDEKMKEYENKNWFCKNCINSNEEGSSK